MEMRVPSSHCVSAWIAEQAAWLLSVRTAQSDGTSPYKRLRGRNCPTRMLAFGERCLFKFNKVAHQKAADGKMNAKWGEGVFLGYSKDSNEFVLWNTTTRTITRARSIQRRPESARWSAEELMAVNQRPGDSLYRATMPLSGRHEAGQDFEQRLAPEDEVPRTRATSTRDMKVTLGI